MIKTSMRVFKCTSYVFFAQWAEDVQYPPAGSPLRKKIRRVFRASVQQPPVPIREVDEDPVFHEVDEDDDEDDDKDDDDEPPPLIIDEEDKWDDAKENVQKQPGKSST